ncbi:uncharacterized protein LOC131662720 [Phymastichus coffea]|uniref:uncharacterized protein LOC131662720 n=1 Tax=Phymastichus coffea TaxID=108790 RepID=UPI00273C25B7|nr:uncharacterized protein LOC131662720 [Phymastichus coffea]
MDPATRRVWEEEREEKTSEPTFEQLGEFLQRRFRTLRSLYPPTSALPQSASASNASRKADQSLGPRPLLQLLEWLALGQDLPVKWDLQKLLRGPPQPAGIDIVIGADAYSRIIQSGVRSYGPLLAQNTVFGWTLTGPVAADVECEAAFARGCSRDPTGRYTVALPLRPERVALLGESLSQARSALASMHRRMQRDQELSGRYHEFMAEYENLGHMRQLTAEELAAHQGPAVYIPHHEIWQHHDRGRKLRVVFNASRPTSSGYSLNDALHAGPKLQGHVATMLTRWRLHRYAFCVDIQMMFHQIRVRPKDVHLQRVLWSQDADSPVHHYALQTVTYGEACAPYLALQTIRQLCADEGARFPLAREAAENDLYMDNFLSGGHSLETTRRLRDQLIALHTAGGFHLRKWVASDPALLEDIAVDDRLRPSWVHLSADGPFTELGLTKRKALAELSSIFDPAGWLAPITLVAKTIVQDLWRAKLSWDEILPQAWQDKWSAFRSTILAATESDIPRWIGLAPDKNLQLHAFADASRRALAAAVYSRVTDKDGSVTTALLNARTKLSSIKSLQPASTGRLRMTIPRLDLRAALIASQLLTTTASALKVPISACHLWSDSHVALHWLQSDEPVGNDIVDNYIAHVQELVDGATLLHVPTTNNPADIASRGVGSDALKDHRLWWTGPKWLSSPESAWPQTALADDPPSTGPDDTITACLPTDVAVDKVAVDVAGDVDFDVTDDDDNVINADDVDNLEDGTLS